jgi:hypothetical protein
MAAPSRIVHQMDALQFLREHTLPDDHAVFTSLPDSTEVRSLSFDAWRQWFVDAVELVVRSTPPRMAAIFYQTDVKRDGAWIDKAYLVQRGAEAAGARLLWHKIVCRAKAGQATFGRPGYAHLLCFSHELRDAVEHSTADVLPELGAMTWPRAIGLCAAEAGVRWLRDHAAAKTVVDPFCGIGTVLAIANRLGLHAIGVERNPGRADKARELAL